MDTLVGYNYDENTHHKIKTDIDGNLFVVSRNSQAAKTSLSTNQNISGATIDSPQYSAAEGCNDSNKAIIVVSDDQVGTGNYCTVQISDDNTLWYDYKQIFLFDSSSTTRTGSIEFDLSCVNYIRLKYTADGTMNANLFKS